jgi:copper chaperone NosL
MRAAVMALVLLTAAGCPARADGPPEIVVDRSACSHCGMLVSERVYAAAYRAPGSEARVFDDIGCLIAAARKESAGPLRVWFHDGGDGAWIEGDAAAFVASSDIRTPMSGGILAYRQESAAAAAAAKYRGEVVRTLADLMTRTGDRP